MPADLDAALREMSEACERASALGRHTPDHPLTVAGRVLAKLPRALPWSPANPTVDSEYKRGWWTAIGLARQSLAAAMEETT